MGSNANPLQGITEGLTTAFSLANMIHRQRIEDQSIQLQKQREQDIQQEQMSQQQRQETELQMKLHAMGARQMTPGDELEANSGIATKFNAIRGQQTPMGGEDTTGGLGNLPQGQTQVLPSFEQSDLKTRLVKAGGQKWVLPTQEEDDARTDRASQRATAAKVAETTATETAKGNAKIGVDQSRLDKFGIAISDENAKLLGIKPGSKIQEEHLDDYNRALASAWARKQSTENNVMHAVPMYGEHGTGVAVVKKDGTVTWNPIDIGDKFTKPTKTSPNEQRLMDKQATDDLVNETAGEYAQKFPKFEDAEAALKADAETHPFVKKQYLRIRKALPGASTADKPKTVNNMTPEDAMNALQGSQGTPKAAPKTAAPPAAPAPATPIRKRAYNPKTKETLEYDGKAWVKLKKAA